MDTQTRSEPTIETLRHALEQSDAPTLIGLYADDAELQIIDKAHPPGNPLILRGKTAIADLWTDICGRDMTHQVEAAMAGGDRWAVTEICRYADGTRVYCMAMMELRDGRIGRQTNVQAWDEVSCVHPDQTPDQ